MRRHNYSIESLASASRIKYENHFQGITYHSSASVITVCTKATMAKDHVHIVFGLYIFFFGGGGVTFMYPSLARKPPCSRLKVGSNDPPKSEALDVLE